LPITYQLLTDFQNPFTGRLNGKCATNSYLNIPPHLKYATTLPCEIQMSENWRQSETLSQKNKTPYSCPQLRQMLTDFQNCFTVRLCRKFVIKMYLNIPPRLKHVATLPVKYLCSKNCHAEEVIEADSRVRLSHSTNCFKMFVW